MNDLTKNILLWVVIVLVLLAVFSRYMPAGRAAGRRSPIPRFLDDVKANRVESVVLQGDMIYGKRKDATQFKTFNPETDYTALIGALQKAGRRRSRASRPSSRISWRSCCCSSRLRCC